MTYYKKKYNLKKSNFPNANLLVKQILCLPIYPQMTDKEIKYVVSQF